MFILATSCHRSILVIAFGAFALLTHCTHLSEGDSTAEESLPVEQEIPGVAIDFWVRSAGSHAFVENPDRSLQKTLTVPLEQKQWLQIHDHQYEKKIDVKAIDIYDLIELYEAPERLDLVLLHFENGVMIPIPRRRNVEGMPKAKLAVAIRNDRGQWDNIFPNARRPGLSSGDKLPLLFRGNKIVSESLAHPYVPKTQQSYFSPWQHADSLVGIEFVTFKGYYGQFDFAETEAERAGYNAFMVRCQFCHGAQSVGAKLGWDFVTPLKLYTRRNAKSLYYHTKFEPRDAAEKGRRMPVQADLTPAEAAGIWAYMEKLASEDLRPYEP